MITLFTLPRSFEGDAALRQRNALRSWQALAGEVEVVLVGDDAGVAEAAREFGMRHIPQIERNDYGTPRVDDLFARAQREARGDLMLFCNTDILLPAPTAQLLEQLGRHFDQFLLVGQRWDLEIREELDFRDPELPARLRARAAREGTLHYHSGVDYVGFRKGFYAQIPPFAIGRYAWDNWLVRHAVQRGAAVVDATDELFVLHQNHDYSHVSSVNANDDAAFRASPEATRNRELAGSGDGREGNIQNAANWRLSGGNLMPAAKTAPGAFSVDVDKLWAAASAEATAAIEAGQHEQALQVLKKIEAQAAHHESYHYIIGVAFAHLGRVGQAVAACRKALRINPGSEPARQLIEALGGDASTPWADASQGGGSEKAPVAARTATGSANGAGVAAAQQDRQQPGLERDESHWLADPETLLSELLFVERQDLHSRRVAVAGPARASLAEALEGSGADWQAATGTAAAEAFDLLIVPDLRAISADPADAARKLSEQLKPGGTLLACAVSDPEPGAWDITFAQHLERDFRCELELHYERSAESGQTLRTATPFDHYKASARPAVVLLKMRRSERLAELRAASAPSDVAGSCFSVDRRGLDLAASEPERIKDQHTDALRQIAGQPGQANRRIAAGIERSYERIYAVAKARIQSSGRQNAPLG